MGDGEWGMKADHDETATRRPSSPIPIPHLPFGKTLGGDMRDVQRIAIVDPSDSTREELRNVLLGMESIWLEAECSRYEFFGDVIRQSQPDVVVISLDSDQTKALNLIQTLCQESPDLPVLAISARG